MKHLATIQTEFLKEAAKWEDLSYEAQKKYLQEHRKSKKKMTAKPGEGGADISDLEKSIDEKRKSMHDVDPDNISASILVKRTGVKPNDFKNVMNILEQNKGQTFKDVGEKINKLITSLWDYPHYNFLMSMYAMCKYKLNEKIVDDDGIAQIKKGIVKAIEEHKKFKKEDNDEKEKAYKLPKEKRNLALKKLKLKKSDRSDYLIEQRDNKSDHYTKDGAKRYRENVYDNLSENDIKDLV